MRIGKKSLYLVITGLSSFDKSCDDRRLSSVQILLSHPHTHDSFFIIYNKVVDLNMICPVWKFLTIAV